MNNCCEKRLSRRPDNQSVGGLPDFLVFVAHDFCLQAVHELTDSLFFGRWIFVAISAHLVERGDGVS